MKNHGFAKNFFLFFAGLILGTLVSFDELRACRNATETYTVTGYPFNSCDGEISRGFKQEYRAWFLANTGWHIYWGGSGTERCFLVAYYLHKLDDPRETFKAYLLENEGWNFDEWVGKPEPAGIRKWLKERGLEGIWNKL